MKLWILEPKKGLKKEDNPWNPWYDKCFCMVVRAGTEKKAREIAHKNARDENRGEFMGAPTSLTKTPWLDNKYSTCKELKQEGKECLIIQDVYSA